MIYPDTKLEERLWKEGYRYVVGIDEAGRGPLAGPVVAGAVVIDSSSDTIPFVTDSKKMSEKRRLEAFDLIQSNCLSFGVGIVEAKDIDRLGIQRAVLEAMTLALRSVEDKLGCIIDYIIADGKNILNIEGYKMDKITKGDLYHYSISAASVLAKVTRDNIMHEYHNRYPVYGFDSHVGYGTKKHLEAIKEYGICDIHRRSFKPISMYCKDCTY